MKKRIPLIACLAAVFLCAVLCGCGRTAADPEASEELAFAEAVVEKNTTHVTMVISEGETVLLDQMEGLESADLSGSENVEEIAAWAAAHPEVDVTYTVTLPDGQVVDNHTQTLDLAAMSGAQLRDCARLLALLPELTRLHLGAERPGLDWDTLAAVRQALPEADLDYSFVIYGQSANLSDTTLNFSHVPVEDNGELADTVMGLMKNLTYVDMDSCGLPNWRMADIRDAHPNVKLVWRVWFGTNYSVRTDVERILASRPSTGGELDDYNTEGLYYCTEVKYLDVGHNEQLTDIGFVRYMPKLEVAILAMCGWSDASPLAACTNLEYLELFNCPCTDLSPLAGLTNLRHLNVACMGLDALDYPNTQLRDITPLYNLTGLERLWLGSFQSIPAEQIEHMQQIAPQCEINTTVYEDPAGGHWRYLSVPDYFTTYFPEYHERYIKLREQFGEYESTVYSFYWNDPLY